MRRRARAGVLWPALVVVVAWGGCARQRTLLALGAVSFCEVLEEVARRARIDVQVGAAASSTVAHQILAGAPAGLVVTAHPRWMDVLDQAGALALGTRTVVARNRLVLVASARRGRRFSTEEMRRVGELLRGRVAVGDPEHVPAGIYARRTLEALGQWESLRSRLLPAMDARAALALVEAGEADWGIVYATDAARSSRVEVVGEFPPSEASHVLYEAAIVAAHDGPEPRKLLDALRGPVGAEVLRAAGFVPVR